MKNALLVFKRDVKSIIRNPVAIIIVLGICIIPSLYAWVNIKACWDTYKNTSTIPIAVVNNDKGSVLNDKEINVGNDVVEELKNNNEIGWEFVSEKEADLGLVDGTYYAMIQIPEDFSQDLTSIVSVNIKKPEIIYKVQTKSNPVAVKIAGAAKTSLIDQVTSNFIKAVNETIFSVANDIGEKADENKDKIKSAKALVTYVSIIPAKNSNTTHKITDTPTATIKFFDVINSALNVWFFAKIPLIHLITM